MLTKIEERELELLKEAQPHWKDYNNSVKGCTSLGFCFYFMINRGLSFTHFFFPTLHSLGNNLLEFMWQDPTETGQSKKAFYERKAALLKAIEILEAKKLKP